MDHTPGVEARDDGSLTRPLPKRPSPMNAASVIRLKVKHIVFSCGMICITPRKTKEKLDKLVEVRCRILRCECYHLDGE